MLTVMGWHGAADEELILTYLTRAQWNYAGTCLSFVFIPIPACDLNTLNNFSYWSNIEA